MLENTKTEAKAYLSKHVPNADFLTSRELITAYHIYGACAMSDKTPFAILLANRTYRDKCDPDTLKLNHMTALAAVYEAGRIAGIRQERAKKKAKIQSGSGFDA